MKIIILIMLSVSFIACTTDDSQKPAEQTINCNLLGNSQDLNCFSNHAGTSPTNCSWRGQACSLDECGIAPSYPGYLASTSDDGSATTLATPVWNAVQTYMDQMQAFQACEISRQ